jgi:meso-butanediol dehydrogenase / (S,S)-butanediol dehydrogenase / diacetyl reductase
VRLAGKVALVTGGGTGIGAAVARLFAAEGARVVLLGRRLEPIEGIADEIGGAAVAGDAADARDVRRAVSAAIQRFEGLDVLVAAAGSLEFGEVLDVDEESWEADLRSNLTTAVVSARAALPALIERGGGSIVFISSVGGLVGTPKLVTYTTSKTALIGLTRSLAVDYGPSGVRVNAVAPGVIRSAMSDSVMDKLARSRGISIEEAYEQFTSVIPLRRPAELSEIASVCLFLASSDASFVTGAVIVADGGHTVINVGAHAFSADTP